MTEAQQSGGRRLDEDLAPRRSPPGWTTPDRHRGRYRYQSAVVSPTGRARQHRQGPHHAGRRDDGQRGRDPAPGDDRYSEGTDQASGKLEVINAQARNSTALLQIYPDDTATGGWIIDKALTISTKQ